VILSGRLTTRCPAKNAGSSRADPATAAISDEGDLAGPLSSRPLGGLAPPWRAAFATGYNPLSQEDSPLTIFAAQVLVALVAASSLYLILKLLHMTRHAWTRIRIAYGADKRIPEDATSETIPVPTEATRKHDALLALGFTRLGEERVRIPTKPSGGIGWFLLAPSRTTVVNLSKHLAIFASYFGDRYLVTTFYPIGERIRALTMRADHVAASIEAAYNEHLAHCADPTRAFGMPTEISSMPQYLAMEVIWRRKTGLRLLRRQLTWDVVTLLSLAYTLGAFGYIAFSTSWPEITLASFLPRLRILSFLVLPVIAFIIAHDVVLAERARKLALAK